MEQVKGVSYRLQGVVGERAEKNIQNWLSTAPFADNAIFTTFQQREQRQPDSPIMGFASEFPGKLLTGIAECYRLNRGDERLLNSGNYLVKRLKEVQGDDGYLGLYCREVRYLGTPKMRTWDIWGIYHNMFGLLQWYQETDNQEAFDICLKSADGMCRFFLDENHKIEEAGCYESNGAGGRIFCHLYELTGEQRYLKMAKRFETMWESDGCGDFLNAGLQKKSFHTLVLRRWESLHALMQISDMYRITHEQKYYDAFTFFWNDLQRHDVHNTGGYSSGEGSCGNPYSLSAVELCCSITWAAMTVEYLKMTKDCYAADDLERNLYNGLLGSQNPTGRWWTYSSPMCGQKKPVEDIVVRDGFHFDGCHEINCCSANSARGIGILSDWAVISDAHELSINFFGESEIKIPVDGKIITVKQHTDYPKTGTVYIQLETEEPLEFNLKVRIPCWSRNTKALLNGNAVECTAGEYLCLNRVWHSGDTVDLSLDMSLHYWAGDERIYNCTCMYYGPLLLAFDKSDNPNFPVEKLNIHRENDYQPHGWLMLQLDDVVFDAKHMEYEPVEDTEYPQPWVKFRFKDTSGKNVYLIDYANAGMTHDWFTTWFTVENISSAETDGRKIWNVRVEG